MVTARVFPEMEGEAESRGRWDQGGLNQAIHQAAEKRLEKGVWDTAAATKIELDRVANIIASEAGCKLVDADTKGLASATRKIRDECEGHWLDLKDVARVTLAATDEASLTNVISVLKRVLTTSEGYTFAKNVQTLASSDPCGYSGYNFVVRFGMKPVGAQKPATMGLAFQKPAIMGPATGRAAFLNAKPEARHTMNMTEHQIRAVMDQRAPPVVPLYVGRLAEIQVNTYDMMYAKMGKSTFVSMFKLPKWEECFQRSGIEGGVGHLFYEEWREAKNEERKKYVAELSCRYYRRMRGTDPKPAMGADQLKEEVDAYIECSVAPELEWKKKDGRWVTG